MQVSDQTDDESCADHADRCGQGQNEQPLSRPLRRWDRQSAAAAAADDEQQKRSRDAADEAWP